MRIAIDKIKVLLLLTMLLVIPSRVCAQWSFDVVSVEAYISDHKTQRALLLARSTLEEGNKALHSVSSDAAIDYKEINTELDKYTRAFDVIDALYQSLRTALNARSTYNTVSDRISDYKDLLEQYNDKCLSRGKVDVADLQLITISEKAIENIYEDSKDLYNSLTDLIMYATGAAACSTADLMVVLESINTSMDNIEKHLNDAYLQTWRYIQVRTGYWKASLYRAKTKQEIIDAAYGRWKIAGKLDNKD